MRLPKALVLCEQRVSLPTLSFRLSFTSSGGVLGWVVVLLLLHRATVWLVPLVCWAATGQGLRVERLRAPTSARSILQLHCYGMFLLGLNLNLRE